MAPHSMYSWEPVEEKGPQAKERDGDAEEFGLDKGIWTAVNGK